MVERLYSFVFETINKARTGSTIVSATIRLLPRGDENSLLCSLNCRHRFGYDFYRENLHMDRVVHPQQTSRARCHTPFRLAGSYNSARSELRHSRDSVAAVRYLIYQPDCVGVQNRQASAVREGSRSLVSIR